MAIVSITVQDTGDQDTLWGVPADTQMNKGPIPRGSRHYHGQLAVAALGSGDQSVVRVTLTFPTKFVWIPKSISIWFQSDDATEEFEAAGQIVYRDSVDHKFSLASELSFTGVTNLASRIYRPAGYYRRWINTVAEPQTNLDLIITDQSADTSTAGDVFWSCDFWMYDKEQCLNYPVNLFEQLIPS